MEQWKDVIGYEGMYQVSNYGRVKSIGARFKNKRDDRFLKHGINRDGYCTFVLCKDGVMYGTTAHRLVALHFLDNPDNKPEVNHIDEDKENNLASNLEWSTRGENVSHSYGKSLTAIVNNEVKEFTSISEFVKASGASKDQVTKMIKAVEKCNGSVFLGWK